MRIAALVGAVVVALGLAAGAMLLSGDDEPRPEVSVVFGDGNGLPDELVENSEYRATFTIDWEGPTAISDGQANVYASRLGDTTEDAPAGGWPLVCEAEYDNIVFRARLVCPFKAPGPGEFALLLEVVGTDGDKLGEGLYAHLVVPAGSATTSVP
jgi:hypothetical protein